MCQVQRSQCQNIFLQLSYGDLIVKKANKLLLFAGTKIVSDPNAIKLSTNSLIYV